MLNKIRKLKEKKGFTLVELIVVIAIIAILTAVLVPLINNWTQQAAYTTLDDGAQTVSNSINGAISKIIAGGAPLPSDVKFITGVKAAGGANQLSIQVGKTGTARKANALDADANPAITNPTVLDKIAVEIAKMLDATVPNTCCFYAKINNGAVAGVIYVTANSTTFKTDNADDPKIDATKIKKVDNFDGHEYEVGTPATKIAIGATGEYKKY